MKNKIFLGISIVMALAWVSMTLTAIIDSVTSGSTEAPDWFQPASFVYLCIAVACCIAGLIAYRKDIIYFIKEEDELQR
jgi:hypothetical protein